MTDVSYPSDKRNSKWVKILELSGPITHLTRGLGAPILVQVVIIATPNRLRTGLAMRSGEIIRAIAHQRPIGVSPISGTPSAGSSKLGMVGDSGFSVHRWPMYLKISNERNLL
jgi:hypothetical protein